MTAPIQPLFDAKINKNTDTTAVLPDSANRRYMTDAQRTAAANTSGVNTGDQTITLTGDVTGSGTGSFNATLASIISGGTKGGAGKRVSITFDAKGRITSCTDASMAMSDISDGPEVWLNGVKKSATKEFQCSGTVSGGTVVFNLVNASTSAAVFANVYRESMSIEVEKTSAGTFEWYNYSLSGDKKTLTLTVTRQGTTSGNVLLNLLGALTSVLTGIVYNAAPNGTIVYLTIKGD